MRSRGHQDRAASARNLALAKPARKSQVGFSVFGWRHSGPSLKLVTAIQTLQFTHYAGFSTSAARHLSSFGFQHDLASRMTFFEKLKGLFGFLQREYPIHMNLDGSAVYELC
jgi:hypothetical protein